VSSTAYLQSYSYKSEFFFALINLTILLPIIFFINTLFTFFFFIELNSSIIFYKFISSNCWDLKKKGRNILYKVNISKNYLNMLFFQYWAAFFSSVMIVYVIISYIYLYGTIEWFFINSLNYFQKNNYSYINYLNILIINFILIFAFLIKIGMTPIHLYKLEIYKGLPLASIFFYTTFYFLIFFFFFLLSITGTSLFR
jgi:hypothetical protein